MHNNLFKFTKNQLSQNMNLKKHSELLNSKKSIVLITMLLVSKLILAQGPPEPTETIPHLINYQGVARNIDLTPKANEQLDFALVIRNCSMEWEWTISPFYFFT